MQSVRQSCRPKHQVLILKCYPHFQKGVQEVKPNPSELSYLLYYASTRRSKLQKVGAFLEKRAARDVWRGKVGNVQVTLQILAALIEKVPRDLPLYARSVLTVLSTVLRSPEISLVEETLPTFDVFCRHQDVASLAADQEYMLQYQDVVQTYANMATPSTSSQSKPLISIPVSLRWRNAGLQAIKSVVSSDALGTDNAKQLNIVVPVILANLYSGEDRGLLPLQQKAINSERQEREQLRRRRTSIATVQTVDTVDGHPGSAARSTADADKFAEAEVRVLALRCLEKIFSRNSNRGQLRIAAALALKFTVAKHAPNEVGHEHPATSPVLGTWSTNLMELIAKWAPVQDRFIILVTALETMIEQPIARENLESQLIIAKMVDWLLSSPINLIGLSVIDVLIALLQHMLLLLQLKDVTSVLAHQPGLCTLVRPRASELAEKSIPDDEPNAEKSQMDSDHGEWWTRRQQLLDLLRKCIGDLATHIYYADQVTDMIKTVISRLKPSIASETSQDESTPQAGNESTGASAVSQGRTPGKSYFSFAEARSVALKAIKDFLVVANLRKSMPAGDADSRNRVPIQVWEDTQWLLRDPEWEVRYAYADAFLSWLQLETDKSDLTVAPAFDPMPKVRKTRNYHHSTTPGDKLGRRAISSASQREKAAVPGSPIFLQLMHLAVYDAACDSSTSESEILLLHLLLANLAENMGVNAARYGVPVMMRLQRDFVNGGTSQLGTAAIYIGSLVHGYLWTLIEKFDLEATKVGADVVGEIAKRKKQGVWLEKIVLPPRPLNHITTASNAKTNEEKPPTEKCNLTPFTALNDLVNQIENAYNMSALSRAVTPGAASGRVFSLPPLGYGHVALSPAANYAADPGHLPSNVKEQMLSSWSKEACLAEIDAQRTKPSSGAGSKAGTGTSGHRNYLLGNGIKNGNGSPSGTETSSLHLRQQGHPHQHGYPILISSGGAGVVPTTVVEGVQTPISTSSLGSTVRVNDLRRVLSVINHVGKRHPSPLRLHARVGSLSSAESSAVSDDISATDSRPGVAILTSNPATPTIQREDLTTPTASTGVLHNLDGAEADGQEVAQHEDSYSDEIPPVPPLPSGLAIPGGYPNESSTSVSRSPSYSPIPSDRPATAPSSHHRRSPNRERDSISTPNPRQGRSLTREKSRSKQPMSDQRHFETPVGAYAPRITCFGSDPAGVSKSSSRRVVSSEVTPATGGMRSLSQGGRVDVDKLLEAIAVADHQSGRAHANGVTGSDVVVNKVRAVSTPPSDTSKHEMARYYHEVSRTISSLGTGVGAATRSGIGPPPY